MLFDDGIDSGEAQPGALADRLGSKERFEDSGFGGFIHTAPGISNGEADKIAGTPMRLCDSLASRDAFFGC